MTHSPPLTVWVAAGEVLRELGVWQDEGQEAQVGEPPDARQGVGPEDVVQLGDVGHQADDQDGDEQPEAGHRVLEQPVLEDGHLITWEGWVAGVLGFRGLGSPKQVTGFLNSPCLKKAHLIGTGV